MLNRAAIMLIYKKPAIDWINDADPYEDKPGISIDEVNAERTIYLVNDQIAEDPETIQEWAALNYEILFENELESWYVIEDLWPEDRNLDLFHKWFDVQCHSVIFDTVGTNLIDDKI